MCKFSLLWTIFIMTLYCLPICSASCSPEQLDVSQIQRALDKCRKNYYSETAPIRGSVTETRSTIPAKSTSPTINTEILTDDSIQMQSGFKPIYFANSRQEMLPSRILTPPAATDSFDRAAVNSPSRNSKFVIKYQQILPQRLTNYIKRTPRSFGSLRNDATPVHSTLKLERGSWGVGANDKKCDFYCAYVELGLMDEEGRLIEGQLRRLLESAARSPELKSRAGELVELCQYKMLHVSTIDPTQMECDFPLMLTRCVLGRLSKHCEDHAKKLQQVATIHPDVEFF